MTNNQSAINSIKALGVLLMMLVFNNHIEAGTPPDLASLRFTEHASTFLSGIATSKTVRDNGLVHYEVKNLQKCPYAGLVMDDYVYIGAVKDIIAYYDIQTNLTATTNKLLKALIAKYNAPTKKIRDDGNTRAYYWITPSVFVRFMSGEATHNAKKEIYSFVQIGNINAIKPFPDEDITSAYNLVSTIDQPQTIARMQGAVTNGTQKKVGAIHTNQPYYQLSFSGSACRFTILVNDVPAITYTDAGSINSQVPINHLILKSGPQTISCTLLPLKGQTSLNKNASLSVKIIKSAADALDQDATNVAIFKPITVNKPGVPQFQQSFQFNATVPYVMAGWEHGVNLKTSAGTHAEVIAAYQKIANLLSQKKYADVNRLSALKMTEIETATYTTRTESESEWKEVKDQISKKGSVIKFDSKNARLCYYGNGKLVALVQPNLEPALHITNAKEKEDYQWPLIFYKKNEHEPLTLIR